MTISCYLFSKKSSIIGLIYNRAEGPAKFREYQENIMVEFVFNEATRTILIFDGTFNFFGNMNFRALLLSF